MEQNFGKSDAEVDLERIQRENECLQELKLLVKGDDKLEKLTRSILNDRFLMHFVRGKKCNTKKAFSTLQNYISLRKNQNRDMFENKNLPSELPVSAGFLQKLKRERKDGAYLGIVRPCKWDTDKCSPEDCVKAAFLYLEYALLFETYERNGANVILDAKGFGLKHVRQCTPFVIHKSLQLFWNAFPMRYQRIDVINTPVYFTMLFKMVKHMLPSKLRARLHFHGNDLEDFYDFYPRDILPNWIGGDLDHGEAVDFDFEQEVLARDEHYKYFLGELFQSG